MTTQISARGAQYPLTAYFEFSVTDQMKNVSGVLSNLNASGTFEVIPLPPNAVVVGGAVTVVAASNDSGTSTIAVGDSGNATRYLGATSDKTAARTALVPTGYTGTGENIRITLADQNGDATLGTIRVEVEYIVKSRQNETQIL